MRKEADGSAAIGRKECVEFALVLTLVALVFAIGKEQLWILNAAVIIVLLAVLAPIVFYPAAFLWFKLAKGLSAVGPVMILSVVFFLVVVPVGVIRRWMGKDVLRKKEFKNGSGSVMKQRGHRYNADDFTHMF